MTAGESFYSGQRSTYSSRGFEKNSACVGCMLCPGNVSVELSAGGAQELIDAADGVVPVAIEHGSNRSDCGLSALNNNCRNAEAIEVVAQLINEGAVPGVSIKRV